MRRTDLVVLGLCVLSFRVNAADMEAYLDSTNGGSAFVVRNANSNAVLSVKSDGDMRLHGTLSVSDDFNRGWGLKSMLILRGGDDVEIGNEANGYFNSVAVGYHANGYFHGAAVGYLANGFWYGSTLGRESSGRWNGAAVGNQANGQSYGVAAGNLAQGQTNGAAIGREANGANYGAAVGSLSKGFDYGAALGSSADGQSGGAAVGSGANGQSLGAAMGYTANGQNYGVAVGHNANGQEFGAALGSQAYAQNSGAAVGYRGNGQYSGAAVGPRADGQDFGAAVGNAANGKYHGAAVGPSANGQDYGAAVGCLANGQDYGAALGYQAEGQDFGAALGYFANGSCTNVAVGYLASCQGGTNRIAIGKSVTNTVNDSARIRGTLYLDGGTGILCRTTFGSGGWTLKAFMIDHPLEPESKVLRHYCLEGPDVWNVYAGNAKLVNGRATVELPAYYSALNKVGSEIYSLTPVGGVVALGVTEEVQDNRFVISGEKDVKVSWTIKVLRNDPGCQEDLRRRPVEQLKSEIPPDRISQENAAVNTFVGSVRR